MRMRKKKHGAERINACSHLLVKNTTINEENSQNIFACDKKRPLWLEIGCGKGSFVCGMAERYPDVNFIALERIADVAMLAMEKCNAAELQNVRFIIGDVAKLWDIFESGSVDRIYLNFSDPWPKAGHAKRRLTHRLFIEQYLRILKPNGAILFKTDNRGLFDFSLEEFEACGLRLEKLTYDLHNSEWANDNIMTEYERNFSAKGFTINRVEAWRKPCMENSTKKYKLAIFDMDGTILDTIDDITDSLNVILEREGFAPRTNAEVQSFVGNGARRLIELAVGEGASTEVIDRVLTTYRQYYTAHSNIKTKPYDGIPELLMKLRRSGVKLAMVSNKPHEAAIDLCKIHFDGLFDMAVGESPETPRKPCPDGTNRVISALGIKKSEAVYIGDSETDVKTAAAVGIDCVAVDWGFRTRCQLKAAGATVIVSNAEELETSLTK